MKIKAKVENIEIRGREVKHSQHKDADFIIVRFDDETGSLLELIDYDMSHLDLYKRGAKGSLDCEYTSTVWNGKPSNNMKIIGFMPDEAD